MRLGYFINQYPAVSHSFIRREILALEQLGLTVERFAIRPARGGIVDPADQREAEKTRHIVATPPLQIIGAVLKQLLFDLGRSLQCLGLAWRFNVGQQKSWLKTLICLFEACLLAEWLKQQRISHLHVHFGTNSTTIALLASRMSGVGYSFTVHGPEEFDKPENIGLRQKINYCRFVVAISSYGRSQLYRWADFADWSKIQVVHCGLDDDFLQHPVSQPPEVAQLVCVGRLSEQKGQLLLLQAVARLVEEGYALKLLLVGDGPMRDQLQAFIQAHGLSAYVELTGSLSGADVRQAITESRAMVLPSFAEGLPVVIMEALALRRPVISSYVAGIPELVRDGECGWLVPAGSVEDLLPAMREALTASPEVLARMGEAGQRRVAERHAISREAAKLRDLFERFAEQG